MMSIEDAGVLAHYGLIVFDVNHQIATCKYKAIFIKILWLYLPTLLRSFLKIRNVAGRI